MKNMKNKFMVLILAILSFFGVSLNVNADSAPSKFTSSQSSDMGDYGTGIGVRVYYKKANTGVELLCEDEGLKFYSGYTFYYSGVVDDGFIYIIENSPKTGDYKRDYYIQSVAAWWYMDYLKGNNNNISKAKKDLMNSYYNNKTNSYRIINLVNGAKSYKQYDGSIKLDVSGVTFTEENGYYVSSKISVKSSSLKTFSGVTLSGAPTGTTIINNNITNGTGTFQIKVPKSSLSVGVKTSITINVAGTYQKKRAYDYYHGSGWQKVIYSKIYYIDYNVKDSAIISLTRKDNQLKISKVDDNGNALSGAGLTLYKGDCTSSTCSDKYATWTSGTSAKVFKDIPVGKYTLVETKTPAGYSTAKKMLINVTNGSDTFTYKMVDKKNHNSLSITKVDDSGNVLSGAGLTLYKGDCTSSTCSDKYATWTSGTSAKVFKDIPVGKYTLVETKTPAGYSTAAKMLVNVSSDNKTFTYKMIDVKNRNKLSIAKIDETGNFVSGAGLTLYKGDCTSSTCSSVYSTWTSGTSAKVFSDIPVGKYTLVETKTPAGYRTAAKMLINVASDNEKYAYSMIDKKELSVRISKTDITGEAEIPGASLVLTNDNGQVASWVSSTTPHYEVLEPGKYCLKETIAPRGYVLNESEVCFKLEDDGTLYEPNEKGEYTKVDYIKMVNEVKDISVRISKTDITGEPEIPGAKLELTDANNNIVSSWTSTDKPHYENLKPGEYCLNETVAPNGYILSKSSICFKVDMDENIYQKNSNGEYTKVDYIKMVNVAKEAININKLDVDTNEYVKGAILVIKNNKGEIVARWTTGKDSHYVNLNEGEYVLYEESAPKGYELSKDTIKFKVDADGNLYLKDNQGNYSLANGIIMYNKAEEIIIPATGLSSTLTYVIGGAILSLGSMMLYRNAKEC